MDKAGHVVLIGGLGFVGRNVCAAFAEQKDAPRIRVIDDLSNAAPAYEALDVATYLGGYQDAGAGEFLDQQTHGARRVFVFLAGETRVAESGDRPLDFIQANIADPSEFVMRNLRAGDHFVLISTAGALFDGTQQVRLSTPYCPKNFYGATKAAEEMVLGKLAQLCGATFSVLRMTNVYGPHSERKKSAIHAFVRAALADEEVTINGDGKQSRDFVYAGDAGDAIARHCVDVLEGRDVPPVGMLGSGVSTSLIDVVAAIEGVSGRPLRHAHTPAKALIASEPRDVIANRGDIAKAMGAQITPFWQGIAQTHDYYAARR